MLAMWPMRFLQLKIDRRLKQIILIILVIACFLLLFPNRTIYDTAVSKLRNGSITDNAEVGPGQIIFTPSIGDYRLEKPDQSDFSRGQSKIIDELLAGKENGYFVDIGSGDGETNSVSLFFERERKWHGVLVEANAVKLKLSINKIRHSQIWNFRINLNKEVAINSNNDVTPDRLFEMINRSHIDLLIINLNGLELDLIRLINFSKYYIRVITIELQNDGSRETYEEITSILASNGYAVVHHVVTSYMRKKDVIYMKR